MNWVDVLVVALAVLAAVSGARQGVITALPAFVGVLLGAVLGILLAPLVGRLDRQPGDQGAFAFARVRAAGRARRDVRRVDRAQLRQKITSPSCPAWTTTLGAVVQGAVVFVVAG